MKYWLLIPMAVLFWANTALGAGLAVEPKVIPQGQPALVRIGPLQGVKDLRLRFMGRVLGLWPGPKNVWHGAIAPDLAADLGGDEVQVLSGDKKLATARVRVTAKDYGVRRITVDPKFMRLTPEQLARHQEEMARQRRVYKSTTPQRFWRGGFVRPVPGKVVGPFGRRSVINGQPRRHHGGVDLRAATGQAIHAAARGRVALVDDTFFGGIVVLLDHGWGLISGYRHLSQVLVRPGQEVARGDIIAKAGSSGRVTGPHLHFDVALGGSRVDPLAWIKASRKLARSSGED
ncbi:MAG: M23 family metallopeptidase [Desulfarculaceae bacterium]|jgi:murein DD-endopeptidase MepM/ murein hydrolase activator NlpD